MDTTDRNTIVDEFNDKARELEAMLEELGQMICDIPNSSTSFHHVNESVAELQAAIHSSHLMYDESAFSND